MGSECARGNLPGCHLCGGFGSGGARVEEVEYLYTAGTPSCVGTAIYILGNDDGREGRNGMLIVIPHM